MSATYAAFTEDEHRRRLALTEKVSACSVPRDRMSQARLFPGALALCAARGS